MRRDNGENRRAENVRNRSILLFSSGMSIWSFFASNHRRLLEKDVGTHSSTPQSWFVMPELKPILIGRLKTLVIPGPKTGLYPKPIPRPPTVTVLSKTDTVMGLPRDEPRFNGFSGDFSPVSPVQQYAIPPTSKD